MKQNSKVTLSDTSRSQISLFFMLEIIYLVMPSVSITLICVEFDGFMTVGCVLISMAVY